jgi:ribosomal protein S18 acetylase RimI-like enzyme
MVPTDFRPKTKPTIRVATLDDVAKIRKMQADSWIAAYPNKEAGVTQEWVLDYTAKWLTAEALEKSKEKLGGIFDNSDHYYRVAVCDDKVVGFVHISRVDGAQHFEAIYLDESQHGTGLAQRLVDEVFLWVNKTQPITVEVASYNKRAIAFYRKYGFEIDQGSEHLFVDTIPVINMIRKGDK